MDKEKEKQYMMTAIMKEFNYQPPLSLPDICEGLVNQGYGNVEQYKEQLQETDKLLSRCEGIIREQRKQAVKEFVKKLESMEECIEDKAAQTSDCYVKTDNIRKLFKELYGENKKNDK